MRHIAAQTQLQQRPFAHGSPLHVARLSVQSGLQSYTTAASPLQARRRSTDGISFARERFERNGACFVTPSRGQA